MGDSVKKDSGSKIAGISFILGIVTLVVALLWFGLAILSNFIGLLACFTGIFQCLFGIIAFFVALAALTLGIVGLVMGAGPNKMKAILGITLSTSFVFLWMINLVLNLFLF